MKNTYTSILLIFLMALIFTACKKDENNFIGKWRATSFLAENCDDNERNIFLLLSGFKCNEVNVEYCNELTFIFDEDGTFTQMQKIKRNGILEDNNFVGTYIRGEDQIKICFDTFCRDIVHEEDMLTFEYKSESSGCDITYVFNKI